jgi:flagellar basal-body rod protein FlgG
MLQSVYTALSGMKHQQYNIDIIGNNIANINTVSFKSGRADFTDALYEQMKRPREAGNYLEQGSGMILGAVQRNNAMGSYMNTSRPLDFMLDGAGYFAVQGPQGTFYTRDGSFRVSGNAAGNWLVTADGYYVLGADGRRIAVPGDASLVTSDAAGNLLYGGARFATLGIAAFANPSGLEAAGGNKYRPTAASGAAAASDATVRQGWLEGSNVDMAEEMTRLLRAQKAFSVLGTAVRTADEMDALANSMSK